MLKILRLSKIFMFYFIKSQDTFYNQFPLTLATDFTAASSKS